MSSMVLSSEHLWHPLHRKELASMMNVPEKVLNVRKFEESI
jgi:hypothetical protein